MGPCVAVVVSKSLPQRLLHAIKRCGGIEAQFLGDEDTGSRGEMLLNRGSICQRYAERNGQHRC